MPCLCFSLSSSGFSVTCKDMVLALQVVCIEGCRVLHLNPPRGTCHDSWDLLTSIVASFKVKACLHPLSLCSLKMLRAGSLRHQLLTRHSATSKMHSPLPHATSILSLILSHLPWCRWMPQSYESQKQAALLNAIRYLSCKKLTPAKRNYDVSNQDILAMKLSMTTKFHHKELVLRISKLMLCHVFIPMSL